MILQFFDKMSNRQGEATVDCDKIASMPTVSFTIGGTVFDLSPQEVYILTLNFYYYKGLDILS